MIVSSNVNAQKKVWVKFGDQATMENDAYSAAIFYELALNKDTSDYKLLFKYGTALTSYQNFNKALPVFLQLKTKVTLAEYPLLDYQIAVIYKQAGNYKKSNEFYKSFVNYSTQKTELEYLKAKNELANYDKVLLLLKDTASTKIKNLTGNVNTGESEFAPVLINDSTLLFSSLRASKKDENGIVLDSNYSSKLYLANKQDSSWMFKKALNDTGFTQKSIANATFNLQKTEIYFSQCGQFNHCQIYVAKWENGILSNVKKLPETVNAPEFNTTHPVLIERYNKKYLLFSSNRFGGKGGMDLWISEFQKEWTAPKNLGKLINSPGNEITPFYSNSDSTLYFSSDWHYNLGGFDVFKSKGSLPLNWSEPINLGIPYNSSLNDLYFSQKDSSNGFVTSSREGSQTDKDAVCCNDIYEFNNLVALPSLLVKVDSVKETIIDNPVVASNSIDPFKFPLTVYFHNDIPNPDSWEKTTTLNYETTYQEYLALKPQYKNLYSAPFQNAIKENAIASVDSFFINHAEKGYADLLYFTQKLIVELEKGNSVELLLKGFASPLTKTDYNVNLSLRRISSIINYLSQYQNGILIPFINGTATNKAKLSFVKNPNGEYKSQKGVSSNYYDVRNSIYNPAAALERRVEVEARFMDSRNK